jgi:putative tryptophan/tyrosine transport system substrate-binding protein
MLAFLGRSPYRQLGIDLMRRPEFITLVGSAAVAWPSTLMAQRPDRVRRIGLMELAARDSQACLELQRGLHELRWLEGSNLGIDYHWAPDHPVLVWNATGR